MPDDRLLRILSQLRPREDKPEATRLCEVSAEVVGMSGAGM
ncbi:MAG: hypothetical protein QOH79_3505, partial [Acidimicrobiaceae bacterium]